MLSNWKNTAEAMSCGRNLQDQWQNIQDNHSHATIGALTSSVLANHGINNFKDRAETCIVLGCYRPFSTPLLIRDSMLLLDRLGIEYMRLSEEYCCGVPPVIQTATIQSSIEDIETAKGKGRSFILKNFENAQQKGAKKMVYCCAACAQAARDAFPDEIHKHIYILDFLLDAFEQLQLLIPPLKIGYFAGCHSYGKSLYPAGDISWARYRQTLNGIINLKIFDIPVSCCRTSAAKLVTQAKTSGCEQIVCSCSGCYPVLRSAAQGILPVYSMQEFLLTCLEYNSKVQH